MSKPLFKAVYTQPRTFEKYDNGRIILYPNETVIKDYDPRDKSQSEDEEESEPVTCTGYQYEGEEPDGGYIRECADMTNLHDVANAIIRTQYQLSEELALQRHYTEQPTEYQVKWQEYCVFADKAAGLARKWLGIAE